MLSILSLNILAPHFAQPRYYPPGMSEALQQPIRREATTCFLHKMRDTCDIIAFQEVIHETTTSCKIHQSHDEFSYLSNVLGDEFIGAFVAHDKHYWNEYGTYIPNGNALFFRRSTFTEPIFYNVPLYTGNHAICGEVTHLSTKQRFRVLNVHLDSEYSERRNREFITAISSLPYDTNIIDIIVGDFNMPFSQSLPGGFIDILEGGTIPTFSFMSNDAIDHIIYRDSNNKLLICDCSGVLHADLWTKYPKLEPIDVFAGPRLKACLNLCGSDHFPVYAAFLIN